MSIKLKEKNSSRKIRQKRIRFKAIGSAKRPRLNIFRSLKHINVQIINDETGKTLVSANDLELKMKKATKTEKAKAIGELIAKKSLEKNIKKVIFDRGGYQYHGRVKAVADGAREGGLEF